MKILTMTSDGEDEVRDFKEHSASESLEIWEHLEELKEHPPLSKIGKKKLKFYKEEKDKYE